MQNVWRYNLFSCWATTMCGRSPEAPKPHRVMRISEMRVGAAHGLTQISHSKKYPNLKWPPLSRNQHLPERKKSSFLFVQCVGFWFSLSHQWRKKQQHAAAVAVGVAAVVAVVAEVVAVAVVGSSFGLEGFSRSLAVIARAMPKTHMESLPEEVKKVVEQATVPPAETTETSFWAFSMASVACFSPSSKDL